MKADVFGGVWIFIVGFVAAFVIGFLMGKDFGQFALHLEKCLAAGGTETQKDTLCVKHNDSTWVVR